MAYRGAVVIRFEFSDEQLRAIRHYYGGKGRADRGQVRTWIQSLVNSTAMDLLWEYDNRERLLGKADSDDDRTAA